MFTPQQIDQITFEKAVFGGYDMASVDELLEPLTQDYVTLYKENALLKSKMRVLVEKLEEQRANENKMKQTLLAAQKASEDMVREAEAKCTAMLNQAEQDVNEKAKNADAAIAAENARVEAAKAEASRIIAQIEAQLSACMDRIRKAKSAEELKPAAGEAKAEDAKPAEAPKPKAPAYDYDSEPDKLIQSQEATADEVAQEIAMNLEKLVGSAPEEHPVSRGTGRLNRPESVTSKFTNLQFGKNYDPTKH